MQSINKSNKNVFKLGSLIEYYPKNNNLPPISGSVYPNLQLFTCNDFLNRVIPQLFFDLNQFITEDKVNKFKNFIVPTHVVATLHFFTSWIKMINFCICLFTVWTLFFLAPTNMFSSWKQPGAPFILAGLFPLVNQDDKPIMLPFHFRLSHTTFYVKVSFSNCCKVFAFGLL